LWDYWPTDRFPLIAVFDFPVPKNDFVNLIRRTNDMDLSDLSAIYDDAPARRELMAFGRLPTEPGSLARSHPPQAPNTVYNTDVSLIFFDEPTFGPYNGWFKKIFSEPRYYDIETNLLWFRDLYARLEAERKPLSWWLRRRGERSPAAQKDFAAFYARFYEHLAEDRADVDAKLAQLKFGRMRETSAESSVPSG
jgi:hypothetical protein